MSDPAERGRRATIEDVAAVAGVSVATVSRALRGLPNVAESTRVRVEQVAVTLNYHAHPSASRLASGRTRNVAIVVPVLNSWYFSEVVAGAEAVMSEAGYSLSVIATSSGDERLAFVRRAVSSGFADGLILIDLPLVEVEVELLRASSLSVVTTGFDCPDFPSVLVDNVAVGRLATQHLIDRGHTRIGILTGQSEDPLHFTVPSDRVDGYRQCLLNAGREMDSDLECTGNFSVDGGREAMSRLLDLPAPPSAVFAMSDEMAFGAIWAVRDRGLDVPSDLAVIGVDDHDMSEMLGLTTICQQVDQHGVIAARRMVESLEAGQGPNSTTELRLDLKVRSST